MCQIDIEARLTSNAPHAYTRTISPTPRQLVNISAAREIKKRPCKRPDLTMDALLTQEAGAYHQMWLTSFLAHTGQDSPYYENSMALLSKKPRDKPSG